MYDIRDHSTFNVKLVLLCHRLGRDDDDILVFVLRYLSVETQAQTMAVNVDIAVEKDHADILADIVGHPQGTPTLEEIDYMNPDCGEDEIRRRLETLESEGIVRVLEVDPDTVDSPILFVELTAEARAELNSEGLYPEEAWKRQYAAVEKTPRIRRLEAIQRCGQ